jgi:hypothetical protein
VQTRDELNQAWLRAERAAAHAETEIRKVGQAAASPAAAEMFLTAKRLREEADRLFRELRVMIKREQDLSDDTLS